MKISRWTLLPLCRAMARSGHEQPVYPSYYPHEIEIAAVDAASGGRPAARGQAARLCRRRPALRRGAAERSAPSSRWAPSWSSGSTRARRLPGTRLGLRRVGAIVREMAARAETWSPIPIRSRPCTATICTMPTWRRPPGTRFWAAARPPSRLKVRAEGASGADLVRPEWRTEGADWDAAIDEVGAGGPRRPPPASR